MSNCRITPVLFSVLVFLFVLNGCGRGMELQELASRAASGEETTEGDGEEAVPGSAQAKGKSSTDAAAALEEPKGEDPCLVHICGAVKEPGVYSLPEGSRVVDAIREAGGLMDNASERDVNQASVISDGMQIVVPTLEEAENGAWKVADTGRAGNAQDGLVDINAADVTLLMTLPGIGQTRAEAIVSFRQQNGNFCSIEDIMKVDGIKEGSFAKLKTRIVVR